MDRSAGNRRISSAHRLARARADSDRWLFGSVSTRWIVRLTDMAGSSPRTGTIGPTAGLITPVRKDATFGPGACPPRDYVDSAG